MRPAELYTDQCGLSVSITLLGLSLFGLSRPIQGTEGMLGVVSFALFVVLTIATLIALVVRAAALSGRPVKGPGMRRVRAAPLPATAAHASAQFVQWLPALGIVLTVPAIGLGFVATLTRHASIGAGAISVRAAADSCTRRAAHTETRRPSSRLHSSRRSPLCTASCQTAVSQNEPTSNAFDRERSEFVALVFRVERGPAQGERRKREQH